MFVGIGVGVGRQRFAGGFADSYSARVLADGGTIEALSCVARVSTLLQQASLLIVPSGYKAGTAYAVLPNNSNGDLTWSRNSTANRTNSSGVIESVGANVPRLSYMYGSCPALLLEPQRTNLAFSSNDLSQWNGQATTRTANQTTSPSGSNDGGLVSVGVDAGSTRHRVYPYNTISVTSGVSYTWSVYLKKNANQWVQLLAQFAFDIGAWANFDLNSGVVGNTGGSVVTARIDSVGNGWYRCSITTTATSTASGSFEVLATNNTNSTRYPAYQSLSAQDVFYLWGGQVEVGAYPTTLIPTTTATVTRLADTFTRNNIYTNGLISASGGTWYVELKNNVSYARDNSNINLMLSDTGASFLGNSFYFRNSGVGRFNIGKTVADVNTASIYNTASDNVKIAIKWNGSTADIFANGVKVVSATSFTSVNLQNMITSIQQPTFIQAMALFNTPLSDSDCELLTT